MAFEEIKAGLEKYTREVEEKLTNTKNTFISDKPIYYVHTERNKMIGDKHWVFAHYPTTQPDTPYMIFNHEENAELFCRVLNAENADVPFSVAFKQSFEKVV